MNIIVNGEKRGFSGKTLAELLVELNLGNGGFAVAVDTSIIPRSKHQEFALSENDEVTIITATHGG